MRASGFFLQTRAAGLLLRRLGVGAAQQKSRPHWPREACGSHLHAAALCLLAAASELLGSGLEQEGWGLEGRGATVWAGVCGMEGWGEARDKGTAILSTTAVCSCGSLGAWLVPVLPGPF